MKNKYCWLVILFALLFIGGTSVYGQKKPSPPPKPKGATPPPPPPTVTRSADITSTDFGDTKKSDPSTFGDRASNDKIRPPRKYVRRCKKYVSKRTGKTSWRCRNVRVL